jgi:hypothetical protein
VPVDREVAELVAAGALLSEAEAEALERLVEARPGDLEARARLLGYHAAKRRERFEAAPLGKRLSLFARRLAEDTARARHALWVTANAPGAPLAGHGLMGFRLQDSAYAEAAALWRKHLEAEPPDPAVWANAITFFRGENEPFAEQLLERAERAFPDDPRRPAARREVRVDELRNFRLTRMVREHFAREAEAPVAEDETRATLAAMEAELRRGGLDPCRTGGLRKEAAFLAFGLGAFAEARLHAEAMLALAAEPSDDERRSDGDLVHRGHLLLGRIALRFGDVERAKAHLALAGKARGRGLVEVFGPSMSLARELLARGERDAVLRFLALTREMSGRGVAERDRWAEQIRAGETPDFGPDRDY